jgi:hypothetical protein
MSTSVPEVPGLFLSRNTGKPQCFVDFLSSSAQISGNYLKEDHGRFLPHLFQLIMHQPYYHFTMRHTDVALIYAS